MDRKRTKELLPLIQDFANGASIQCRYKGTNWHNINEPSWLAANEYRVTPAPPLEGYVRLRDVNTGPAAVGADGYVKMREVVA